MPKQVVMYARTDACFFVALAKGELARHGVPYREILIDQDALARERVQAWTGFLSVPTLVVAEAGDDLPTVEPQPLERGRSPRGVDRGSMLTEPDAVGLETWLRRHGFLLP